MDHHFIQSLAISLGVEDYYGLYELIWGLNARYPEVTESEKVEAAREALQPLLERGLITFFAAEWDTDSRRPLSFEQARQALSLPDSWSLPTAEAPGAYCAFTATLAGEQAYEAGEFKSL